MLLNIPPNKTLLRRHLATHFNLLIGSEAQQLKQECLENPDYTLLTATTKVKVWITALCRTVLLIRLSDRSRQHNRVPLILYLLLSCRENTFYCVVLIKRCMPVGNNLVKFRCSA